MEEKKNLFIAFEGIDGCGKSTQAKILSDRLKLNGIKTYTTFEPTDSPIGSIIRNIMKGRIEADHKTIAALFAADRLDHLMNNINGILNKLEEGNTVITDRYYFSSYAYHSVHMPMDWVIQANSLSAEILRPDLNIYIDIIPEIGMQRLNNDRNTIELYESIENLKLVRKNYSIAIEKLKDHEKVFSIDGNRPTDVIAEDIWNKITGFIY